MVNRKRPHNLIESKYDLLEVPDNISIEEIIFDRIYILNRMIYCYKEKLRIINAYIDSKPGEKSWFMKIMKERKEFFSSAIEDFKVELETLIE